MTLLIKRDSNHNNLVKHEAEMYIQSSDITTNRVYQQRTNF